MHGACFQGKAAQAELNLAVAVESVNSSYGDAVTFGRSAFWLWPTIPPDYSMRHGTQGAAAG
jgi:hypothetical protein